MANHVICKTRKKMTPETVALVLDTLNKTIFKNCLLIKQSKSEGKYYWHVELLNDKNGKVVEWGQRWFWMENSHHFESKHGPGGHFIWWVSRVIIHTIGKVFNGKPNDEGVGEYETPTPEKYLTYEPFSKLMHRFDTDDSPNKIRSRASIQNDLEITPKPHRFNAGKKITFKKVKKDWVLIEKE